MAKTQQPMRPVTAPQPPKTDTKSKPIKIK